MHDFVDGERRDMALERDRQQSQIQQNKDAERFEVFEKIARAETWAEEGTGIPISKIIEEMIKNEVWSKLLTISEIYFDVESIHEAVNNACISLGLSDEDFSPSLHHMGHEVEVRLF